MKLILVVMITLVGSISLAADSKDRGGGDLCEKRIGSIRDDLGRWVKAGGADTMNLPKALTPAVYKSRMETAFTKAKFKCVKPGDVGFPVNISGTPKMCRFDLSKSTAVIACDYATFMDQQVTSTTDQYLIIHHEFAGIAGLENPNGDVSNYAITENLKPFIVPDDNGDDHLQTEKEQFPGLIRLGGKEAVSLEATLPKLLTAGGFDPYTHFSSGGTSHVECDLFTSPQGEIPVCRSAPGDYPDLYHIWPMANAKQFVSLARRLKLPFNGSAFSADSIYIAQKRASSDMDSPVVSTNMEIQMSALKDIHVHGRAAAEIFDSLRTANVKVGAATEFDPATHVALMRQYGTTCKRIQTDTSCKTEKFRYMPDDVSAAGSQLLFARLIAAGVPVINNVVSVDDVTCVRLHLESTENSSPVDTICRLSFEAAPIYH